MPTQKRYPRLDVRAQQTQIDRWKRLAEVRGMPLPVLVRLLLDEEARRQGIF